jgi:hypothetical protein
MQLISYLCIWFWRRTMTSRTSVLRLATVRHSEEMEEERCRWTPWKKREGSSRRRVNCRPSGSQEYFELVRSKAGPCGGAGWRFFYFYIF